MFEKEIKFISDFCLNKIKKLGSTFTFDKLSVTDLHPSIIRYISAELDYMIYADRKKLLQQSYFDYTGKQISQHLHQISDEIKKSKKISMEDAEKLVVQAVSFNANFVIRPKWSLIKLIYNDQHSVGVDDLDVMLKYVYYYDYIKNVLGAYLSKRKVVQLSLTEFELILNKIDRELFKSNSEQLIDNALNSMGDFFNIGGVDKTTVSASGVEILLKEKNLIEYLMRLRKNVPEGGKKKLSIDDMRRILYTAGISEENVNQNFNDIGSGKTFDEIDSSFDKKTILSFQEDIKNETTIGELADRHAKEIELSETGELLSPEDEQKLLSLYEADLSNFEEDITDAISHKDDFDSFNKIEIEEELEESDQLIDENINQPDIKSTNKENVYIEKVDAKNIGSQEKDIVDEMIRDFFGDEEEDEETIIEELEELTPVVDEKKFLDQARYDEELTIDADDVVNKKNDASLEDELLEVFDELEKLGDEPEPETDNDVPDESEISEFDSIDKDLETIDRIAFTEDRQKINTERKVEPVIQKTVKEIVNQPIPDKSNGQESEIKPQINQVKLKQPEKPIQKAPLQKPVQSDEDEYGRPIRKKDLLNYLKRKDIKKIISYVFSGDREDFVTTAERIMDCKGYKEASEILRSVFSSYKISHYSKDAITLTNAVSNYFRQA